jgi:hypothetical protein
MTFVLRASFIGISDEESFHCNLWGKEDIPLRISLLKWSFYSANSTQYNITVTTRNPGRHGSQTLAQEISISGTNGIL